MRDQGWGFWIGSAGDIQSCNIDRIDVSRRPAARRGPQDARALRGEEQSGAVRRDRRGEVGLWGVDTVLEMPRRRPSAAGALDDIDVRTAETACAVCDEEQQPAVRRDRGIA